MKIVTSITGSSEPDQKLGFSVWARSGPKSYLAEYPKIAKGLVSDGKFKSVKLVAFIDDVLPMITLGRTINEQRGVSKMYLDQMSILGFDSVHLVSDFVSMGQPWEYMKFASAFTSSEFAKLVPKSKGEKSDLTLSEVVGFLWHLRVMESAMRNFQVTGFLAGIRSQFFYLAARQVLPSHNVYFLGASL